MPAISNFLKDFLCQFLLSPENAQGCPLHSILLDFKSCQSDMKNKEDVTF